MHIPTVHSSYHRLFTICIVLCASLGGILYGYDIGVISGALLFIKQTIPMSRMQMGVMVGAVLSGGLVGTLLTGMLADQFGRRAMIKVACVVFAAGIFIILIAKTFITLFIARLLLGVGIGIVSVAVPLYLAEVAPAKIRGRSVTSFQLFLTFGILLAYLIDLVFTPSGNWRGMFAVILIPTLLLFIGMMFLPETPRWLLSKRKSRRAHKVLLRTRPKQEAKYEFQSIQESLHLKKNRWIDLFARRFWLPLFVAISIAALNQLTGINVLLQYAPLVIQKAGLNSHVGTMLATVGIGLINFLGTVIALFFIDHLGRRRLLIFGTLGIIVSYVYLALLTHMMHQSQLSAELSLVGLFGYIVFYAVGPGVVVWLAISELLPTEVRGKAVAFCLFINLLAAALLSTFFLSIVHDLGIAGTYGLFAVFTFLYFLVSWFLLPETKRKTLEEIQAYYEEPELRQQATITYP